MMQTMKRGLALLIVLVMCLSLVPTLILNASAAEVNYVYSSQGYIYNWGSRGTVATFLSPNAENFYKDNNTSYEELAANSGASNRSDVPYSDLYKELKDLMASNHKTINSYDAAKNFFQYTDCQNGGGKISSFYSGTAIGPAWGQGGSWNREHTWPNSKGLGGSDENDIMMLRPTSTSENSSRGNTAYGQSSGYYNPNSEAGGKYDLRGDVARIFLYVYVRWGNRNYAWGTSGVMESVDVLLEWMEADPVDTWELGRNDSVESITGTRNVFVDYPELAFVLFDAEIPSDMSTPSGEASDSNSKCNHNNFDAGVVTAPTCTGKGYTIYTCLVAGCGYSYKDNVTAALGHQYSNGVCSACGETEPSVPTYVTSVEVGKAYKLGLYSTNKSAEYFFNGTMKGYYGATDTAYSNGVDVYVEQASGGYHLYFTDSNGAKKYINLVVSGTYRNFTFASSATTVFTWDTAKYTFKTTLADEVCYIGTFDDYYTMGVLQTSKLSDNDYFARLYTMSGGSQDTPSTPPVDTPTCQHNYTSVVTAPTCTAGGFTTYTCTLCNHSYVDNKTAAKGHSYTNGTCTNCGATQPSNTQATITFDDSRTGRTVFNTSQQVWVQNGITVTNDKASSPNDVADYSNPVRFYMGSNVTIAFPGMTKMEINCAGLSSKYVSSWLSTTNATATNNGGIITVVFDTPVDSFTYTGLAAQSRAYSITVYADGQSQPSQPPQQCQHTNTTVEGAINATCSTDGYTGKISCLDCGMIVNEGEIILATGHNYIVEGTIDATCSTDGHTGKTYCSNCESVLEEGEIIPATGHVFAAWVVVRTPNCTAAGLERRDCDGCTYYETKQIPVLDHSDENNDEICDVCQKELAKEEETTPSTPDTPDTPDNPETPDTPDDDNTTENEEHVCKEVTGFQAFINKIINFFRRLFGQPELCSCGEIILEKKD